MSVLSDRIRERANLLQQLRHADLGPMLRDPRTFSGTSLLVTALRLREASSNGTENS